MNCLSLSLFRHFCLEKIRFQFYKDNMHYNMDTFRKF